MIRQAFILNLTACIIVLAAFAALLYTVPARGASCTGESGVASYYGEAHHGKLMANGKPFDQWAMTAASWNYPLGTKVRVTNAAGESVFVTITDRGPAKRLNRVIDLSRAAFAKLAPLRQGLIRQVCVRAVS